MIPIGYMYRKISKRPDWLNTEAIHDIYSVSNCFSKDFTDYINYWKHNGYWFFDSPQIPQKLAQTEGIDLSEMTLFYYETYEYEFNEDSKKWDTFSPEPSFITNIEVPLNKQLEGFDVVTFTAHASPECSPLSCNSLATMIPVNKHCLLRTFAEAKDALESGLFHNSEPGPYRIIAVYKVS